MFSVVIKILIYNEDYNLYYFLRCDELRKGKEPSMEDLLGTLGCDRDCQGIIVTSRLALLYTVTIIITGIGIFFSVPQW